ncbi:effector-associated constant component EACC1 [Micromonospora sp. NBC_01412]|uniref:effector-associated constant component EACC1 n=1 Tax=Micromonospora sp. NBC_01412 TaxID=2903590 RepID=UPI003250EBE0
MRANITLVDGTAHDLASLYAWLQRNDELRGRIKAVTAELKPGDMGSVTEMLTVALGSGGVAAALGGALNVWLSARRAKVNIEITEGDSSRRIEVDSANADTTARLLQEASKAINEHS